MAMTSSSSPAQKEETPTVSGATKRSSSVGRAFTRLFSRSPPEKTAQRSTSEASALGPPNPGSSQGSDGGAVRGRTPPRGLDTSSPTTDAMFGQSSQPPNPNSHQFHCLPLSLTSSTTRLLRRGIWVGYYCNSLIRAQPWPCRIVVVIRLSRRQTLEQEDYVYTCNIRRQKCSCVCTGEFFICLSGSKHRRH